MNELALFAGAGGGILASQILGWSTVAACEIEDYPRKVLMQRQDDGILEPFPVWDDIQTLDGKPFRGHIDIITGGFPCQDISAAGKGAGITGKRSGLWSEMARIIDEVRPRFVFAENSPILACRGLDQVICDFAQMGYDVRWCVLGAWHIGANHRRDRIWILAHRDCPWQLQQEGCEQEQWRRIGDCCHDVSDTYQVGRDGRPRPGQKQEGRGQSQNAHPVFPHTQRIRQQAQSNSEINGTTQADGQADQSESASEVPHANGQRLEIWKSQSTNNGQKQPAAIREGWWQSEPAVGRLANGVANRVDRLKALGNGQVPAVAAAAFRILSDGLINQHQESDSKEGE